MWPEARRLSLEHRLNGNRIGAHLTYTYNPTTEILSVVYVVDDPVYSPRVKYIFKFFEEDILRCLASDIDERGTPQPRKTKILIMPGYVNYP